MDTKYLQLQSIFYPVVLLITAINWVWYTIFCLMHTVEFKEGHLDSMILLYTSVVGGYHLEIAPAEKKLQSLVLQVAPEFKWENLVYCRLFLDDQLNKPYEQCRATIGWVVSSGCVDMHHEVDAWQRHHLVQVHGMSAGIFAGGRCMCAQCPSKGPLSYAINAIRAYSKIFKLARSGKCRAKVPGCLELHEQSMVKFILPLDSRDTFT